MKIGQLIWDARAQRVDIIFRDGTFYGGLHCGSSFDVLLQDAWIATRIEYCWSDAWYLVGLEHTSDIFGLTVRM
jgi:hypothetical protein